MSAARKITKRKACGAAELLVADPGLEGARTRLIVAVFDPEFVLGDRKQGRWSLTGVDENPEPDAAEWGDCVAIEGRPAVFVAIDATKYSVWMQVEDHAEPVVEATPRPSGSPVVLRGGPKGLELRVGAKTRVIAWSELSRAQSP